MTDESLLTLAKLREQARGQIEGPDHLLPHGGLPVDGDASSALTFLEQTVRRSSSIDADSLAGTAAGQAVLEDVVTGAASDAVASGDSSLASHLVGVTERDLEADQVRFVSDLLGELDRDGALTTLLAAGDPNTGKTNTVWLVTEVARTHWPELVVVSNATASAVDVRVTSAYELAIALLEHREVPVAVVIDEGSSHFDARTKAHEVATQFSPLHKHMSKLSVELCAVIGHTGKDVVPEVKRLTSLALWKEEPDVAQFYAEWRGDADRPSDPLFAGPVSALERTSVDYEPDSRAPWKWDLPTEVFEDDHDWPDLLEELRESTPDRG